MPDGSEASPRDPFGTEYRPTTRPGHRLPHAWVIDRGKRMSTLDLVQPGSFVLIAGDRGQAWVEAAAAVARETGISLKAVRISGERDWEAVREIAQDGAVLIRPDQHVGWRAMTMAADPAQTLRQALAGILRPSATRAEASALQAASA
ncbi:MULTISPECIES: aromatic-ring hydroxylase C-terminal domain-containing protein [unclassified Sphingobium]|uniref:aromatic-ring hydroxylase C-terminal domain-containing protein n=1 Tax=unclassified Sphingobium TaxID=2611147 RepID=UPI002E276F47|nr:MULTISPECIES: hypothetical protein [unclassified Sphingobium]